MKLEEEFFRINAPELAKKLLGCELVHETNEGLTAGVIVETEAYSQEDAASHTFNGETARTKVMFGPGGYVYIYFTYGMHYCFNVVSGLAGHGQAVLIRALEPTDGIDLMKRRRGKDDIKELCNGPAKLVQAMGFSKQDYGKPVFEGNIIINTSRNEINSAAGPRIGISKAIDVPWRFRILDNPYVSRNY